MKINEFIPLQIDLGITNSILNNSSKLNENLLDILKILFEESKRKSDKDNIKCNVVISKQSDVNSLNIQMSGSTEQNTKYCYDNFTFFADAQKSKGIQLTKESDSYKISSGETKDKSSSVTTSGTTDSITTNSASQRAADIEKLVYQQASDQAKNITESNQTKKILQEQINRMKKIMYR